MKKTALQIFIMVLVLIFGVQFAAAQFNIKIPKINKPKVEPTKPAEPQSEPTKSSGDTKQNSGKTPSGAVGHMERPQPTTVPVLLKDTLEVNVQTRNTYWKTPNEQYHSSWIPHVDFDVFLDLDEKANYIVEWLNTDGSLWFSEPFDGERTSRMSELLDTKASDASGTYGLRIINAQTKAVAFQGKFKVSKIFLDPKSPRYKNQAMFYVDNDWSLPVGYAGFAKNSSWDHDPEPIVSMWFKGDLNADDLEARLFYAGEQISTTKGSGIVEDNSEQRRNWDSCFQQTEVCRYQLWDFTWRNFKVESFNQSKTAGRYVRDPNAVYTKDKPGEYTVKVFHKGVQVRETKFSVQPNGYLAPNPYARELPMRFLTVAVPVKVMGTLDKYNQTAWKTEAFYGNPLTGFAVP